MKTITKYDVFKKDKLIGKLEHELVNNDENGGVDNEDTTFFEADGNDHCFVTIEDFKLAIPHDKIVEVKNV